MSERLVLCFMQHGTAQVYGDFDDMPAVRAFIERKYCSFLAASIELDKPIKHPVGEYTLLVTQRKLPC